MPLNDDELIAGYLQSEPSAVQVIEDWIAQAAWTYRQRLGTQWEDARQDAHLKVVSLLQQGAFRRESSLRTYLWRVVNNVCLNVLRAQRRWPQVDLESLIPPSGPPQDSPFEQLWRKEAAQMRLRIMEKLSPECQQLAARIREGQNYQTMSQELGISEGTLRVKALRCRERVAELRRQWDKKK